MIKTIIFDMDGVLFDTERIYDEAWEIILKEKNVKNIDYVISSCRGLTSEDSAKYIDEAFNGKISGEECLNDLIQKFNEIIEERGVPVKKGVYELLSYLKENGYEIGLASATCRPLVMSHLKEAEIENYFDQIITGEMAEKGKPEPDIYLMACDKFNRKPEECIAVEDSINGVTAAIRAGMNTIMVPDIVQPTKEIEKQLYRKFDSLLDVKDFLENDKSENTPAKKDNMFIKFIKEWIIPIGLALGVWILLNKFVFINVTLPPSGSMIPTLNNNDRLIATRVWDKDSIKRGDILIFKSDELDELLIKRVIGLPGDHIEIVDGVVSVNGEKLNEDYVKNNKKYTGVFDVPENKLFFLGDNREISYDSRYWDNPYIDESCIEGKAQFRYYPFNDMKIIKH